VRPVRPIASLSGEYSFTIRDERENTPDSTPEASLLSLRQFLALAAGLHVVIEIFPP